MAVRFWLYSRWGEQVCRLGEVESAEHYAEINGEDTLTITGPWALAKGDRILWDDGKRWREHVVDECAQEHAGAETFKYVCTGSLQADLELAHIRQFVCNASAATYMASTILAPTSWHLASCDVGGTQDITFERESAYDALLAIAGAFGAEIEPIIELDGAGVASRGVRLMREIGDNTPARVTYGHSVTGITKTVLADEVVTAVYAYGAPIESDEGGEHETDGIQDRLWVLVEDDAAKDRWGLPDGRGGIMHAFGYVDEMDCDDAGELRQKGLAYLADHSTPAVSYEAEIPLLALKGVQLGDAVQVIDRDFTPELRLETRVGSFSRDLITGETSKAMFGTVTSIYPDVMSRSYAALKQARAATMAASKTAGAMATQVTTKQLDLTGADAEGAALTGSLTIGSDGGLYWNGTKIGG